MSWTKEKIKDGLNRFFKENGHFPTALEIDKSSYLPSSRHIQRKFGGLENIRKEFGFKDVHFGKGEFRSKIASKVNKRGKDAELILYKILSERFGEPFVHTEKFFNDSKKRIDFYVYSPSGDFCVDIFYPDNSHSLQSNVNIKMVKYENFTKQLFLVVANGNLFQEELDRYSISRKKTLPSDVKIITLKNFLKFLKTKKYYSNPTINYTK